MSESDRKYVVVVLYSHRYHRITSVIMESLQHLLTRTRRSLHTSNIAFDAPTHRSSARVPCRYPTRPGGHAEHTTAANTAVPTRKLHHTRFARSLIGEDLSGFIAAPDVIAIACDMHLGQLARDVLPRATEAAVAAEDVSDVVNTWHRIEREN